MTPEQQTLISEAADRWTGRYIRRYSDRTQDQYRRVLAKFIESLPQEIKTVDQLKRQHIEAYVDSILDNNLAASSANQYIVCLQSFCNWLYEPCESPNPAAKIKYLREEPPKQRVLSEEEYQKIIDVCRNDQQVDIVKFLGNTGLRAAEFQSLTWDCVSLDCKMITFTGKGQKRRVVPLNAICQEILSKYEREPGQLLPFAKNYRYRSGLCQFLERLSFKAGIPRAGPHAIRHYFATELIKRHVPIVYVSRILGHSSVKITESLYLHLVPQDFEGMTDVLCE